jgi:transcriptional regulator with XRE-family HTH domain
MSSAGFSEIFLATPQPSVLYMREYEDEGMSHVGDRIRNRRLELGWTQEQLAEKARISKGFVSDVETGTRGVSANYLLEIAQALGVSLDYLMKGGAQQPPGAQVEIPSRLSNLAKDEGLTFAQTLMLLDMRRQIKAHRSSSHSDDLEKFDWKQFYEAVKQFLK